MSKHIKTSLSEFLNEQESINWDTKQLVFDITLNKWGGFEMGDGEYFKDDVKDLIESKPDFFIKTIKNGDSYETTFVPNPINKKDTSDWTDVELKESFEYVETYRTNIYDIITSLKKSNGKFGIYELKNSDEIIIDDMLWFYIGLCNSGKLISKIAVSDYKLNLND